MQTSGNGNNSKTSIWWDIENCHVPKDVNPHMIAKNLSAALQRANLTGPIEIQGFGDTRIVPYRTQKALTDTGITLNHVPRGNKDAADKAILVAMLLWALDNPPPANILLISGDGDYANALNRLRWKTYYILLACPAQFVKPALLGAAKKIWIWKDMSMGRLENLSYNSMYSSQDTHKQQSKADKENTNMNGRSSPKRNVHRVEEKTMIDQLKGLNIGKHQSCPSATNFNSSLSELSSQQNLNRSQSASYSVEAAAVQISNGFSGREMVRPPSTVPNYPTSPGTFVPQGHIPPVNTTSTMYPPVNHVTPISTMASNLHPMNNDTQDYKSGNIQMQVTLPQEAHKLPHDKCLQKVYSAMKTLEGDMLAPTEINISDCIQYWDPERDKIDIKQTLVIATELQQIKQTQLGQGLVMYYPPDNKVPWNCINPNNMQHNFSEDVWIELQEILKKEENWKAIVVSKSRYDAARLLKQFSTRQIKILVIGVIIHLIQQAMMLKKWIRRNGPGWLPLYVNHKAILAYHPRKYLSKTSDHIDLLDIHRPEIPKNMQNINDRDMIMNRIRAWLPEVIKDNVTYDLSLLFRDFELASGFKVDPQRLGFGSLQEIMKEFSDFVTLQQTPSGYLFRIVKHGTNGMLDNGVAQQYNDGNSPRQITHELKSWLIYMTTVVQDGYDISRIHHDFLQASGIDLYKEGIDLHKLPGILRQFNDAIQISKTPTGIWVAYSNHNLSSFRNMRQ